MPFRSQQCAVLRRFDLLAVHLPGDFSLLGVRDRAPGESMENAEAVFEMEGGHQWLIKNDIDRIMSDVAQPFNHLAVGILKL